MKIKKILLLLSCIIAIFISHSSVKAEEANPLDSAVALQLNQVLTGSFDGTASAHNYYKIEITQKTAITIYGNNTGDSGISLRLDDAKGDYVSHQSQAISANSDYSWRTKALDPGTYYIDISSNFSKISYTVSYSIEPYPVYTELAQDTKAECNAGNNIFKINVSSVAAITILGDKDSKDNVDVYVSDYDGKNVTCQTAKASGSTRYKYRTDQLKPGVYYIRTRSQSNYTVTYSSDLYPEAILLNRGASSPGSFSSTQSLEIYRIDLSEQQSITFFVTKDSSSYISLRLVDSNSDYVDHQGQLTKDSSFIWSPDKALAPGTYYLEASSMYSDTINYSIHWQISGPSAVKNLKQSKATEKNVTLKWSAPANASKYRIYKYNSKTKNYSLYKTTTSKSCKIGGLKAATKYTLKIVPIMEKDGELIEGTETIFKAVTKPGKVKLSGIKKTAPGVLSGVPVNYYKVSWKKVKQASGYDVYVKTKGSGWKKIDYTSARYSLIYVVKGFSAQIKVRAYISTDDAIVYGSFSKPKTVKSK